AEGRHLRPRLDRRRDKADTREHRQAAGEGGERLRARGPLRRLARRARRLRRYEQRLPDVLPGAEAGPRNRPGRPDRRQGRDRLHRDRALVIARPGCSPKLANLVQTPNQVRYFAAKSNLAHPDRFREFGADEFSLPVGSHQGVLNSTEAQIVRAATAGDRAAFTQLVERYRSELQVHAYRMLGSLEDAQDALQEAFLRAWT